MTSKIAYPTSTLNNTRMFNIPTTPPYDYQLPFEKAFKHQDVSDFIKFKN